MSAPTRGQSEPCYAAAATRDCPLQHRYFSGRPYATATSPAHPLTDAALKAYRRAYLRGWRYSQRVGGLDIPDARGWTNDDAWVDGYMDNAVGREKWHYLNHDAATCEEH